MLECLYHALTRPISDQLPIINHNDSVDHFQQRVTVRDDKPGATFDELHKLLLYGGLGGVIHGTGRLVHQQQ